MPFARPTLTALQQQAVADITAAQLPGVSGLLQKSVLRVLSYVTANFAWATYGYLDWISKQAVPYTSTDEYLEGWAALKGVNRKSATYAIGTVGLTGNPGTTIPSGLVLSASNGQQYTTVSASILDPTGSASVPIVALTSGVDANSTPGLNLTMSSTIEGINSLGVAGELTGGSDIEDDNSLRTRMNQVYAQPPQGGAVGDYIDWALAVPNVTRAWATAGAQVGSVVVYAMLDDANAQTGGYPVGTNGGATAETRIGAASGDQLAIANAIYPLRPVTSIVFVAAPVAQPIPVTITSLSPMTTPVQTAIKAALDDLFMRIGSPTGQTIYPSDINAAIESAAGVVRYTLAAPVAPVVIAAGSLPTVGTMSFSA